MSYYFSKTVDMSYEDALVKTTEELKKEGFGVLTEIDVKETLKKKIDVDFKKYKILGACNPPFAHKALSVEDKIGVFLPCNVIVQEVNGGKAEIIAMNPMEAMKSINNEAVANVAGEITDKLKKVVDNI